jgi:hypothetical protein
MLMSGILFSMSVWADKVYDIQGSLNVVYAM